MRLLLYIFTLFTISFISYPIDDLFAKYPTLIEQVKHLEISEDQGQKILLLKNYLNNNNIEIEKGMKIILQEDIYPSLPQEKKRNYALEILLWLLSKGFYETNDSMPIALALANNRLYTNVDKGIRKEILKDLSEQYLFYKEIVKWQKSIKIGVDLSRMPVFTQLSWADRTYIWASHTHWVDSCKNISEYRNKIISIKTLKELHKIFVVKIKAKNIEEWASALETAASSRFIYDREDFIGLNNQLNGLKINNQLKGHCGSYTNFQLGLYKAAGIPALGVQMTSVDLSMNHGYPFYYHSLKGIWKSVQNQNASRDSDKLVIVQIGLPSNHHWIPIIYEAAPNYWFSSRFKGDVITLSKLILLNVKGMKNKLMENIFQMNQVKKIGGFNE